MAKAASKAPETVDTKAVAVTGAQNVPAMVDLTEFDGDVDQRTGSDLSIPFLNILQPMSPVVVNETIEGAKAGMWHNSVTGEVTPGATGVGFLWCYDQKQFVEWKPRDEGGGLVGFHEVGSPEVIEAIRSNGGRVDKDLRLGTNNLVETQYIYGLVTDLEFKEVIGFAVIPAKSTNLKPAKDWLTARSMVRIPELKRIPDYFFRTVLTTAKDSNESGTWYKMKASPFGGSWKAAINLTNKTLLDESKAFREMVKAGRAKADFSQEKAATGHTGEGEPVPF